MPVSSTASKFSWALVLVVELDGPFSIRVSGGVVSPGGGGGGAAAGPNWRTSCGWSLDFSRLLYCCSESWFSFASRIRKPLCSPEVYMAATIEATFHSR